MCSEGAEGEPPAFDALVRTSQETRRATAVATVARRAVNGYLRRDAPSVPVAVTEPRLQLGWGRAVEPDYLLCRCWRSLPQAVPNRVRERAGAPGCRRGAWRDTHQ